MASNTLTAAELRTRVAFIRDTLQVARGAVLEGQALAQDLSDRVLACNEEVDVSRYSFEVISKTLALARDLGAQVDSTAGGEFDDLERVTRDADDLVDLIDFAATPSAKAAAR